MPEVSEGREAAAPQQVRAMLELLQVLKGQLMDAEARTMLHRFVHSLNQDMPHPLDWQRFYDFIIYSFQRGAFPVDDIQAVLEEEGLRVERTKDRLLSFYEHGVDLLARYQGHR